MEWTGLNELRERYLSFFESKGHARLASAPLVPQDDASLLLINSGMAPLKKYFLGLETPPKKRATSCQKCIRTPDIERVGKTSRHGTFFEMLGNFSFGDYFKEEATAWAWEFVTGEMKIPTDRLYVSVYEDDDDAYRIWTEQRGVDPSHMVRLGKEDNFWEIGSGPCGPCSEIYFDRGEGSGCGKPDCFVGCDCDRYVEIWNLVFTQFNSDGEGNYTPLEHPNIDTGMGLERLACVMQGVNNLFEVDTVANIMNHIASIAGVSYKQDEKTDISLRVATDHIRSTVFMVGDGVVPQNEGRGYVLRRLLRRAARHGRLLGITRPFLFEVCDTVIKENETAYPELAENREYIRKVIQVEEERFSRTIEQGMELLSGLIEKTLQGGGEKILPGEEVFRLHDTFGFPLDLTREIAEDRGLAVDEAGFVKCMEQQRKLAKDAREAMGAISWEDDVLAEASIEDTFVGYDSLSVQTEILQIVRDGELVDHISEGDEAVVILKDTPFYAESGGQVGDTGVIHVGKNIFMVKDCKKSPTGHFMHIGKVVCGFVAVGEHAEAKVDKRRRNAIARNHTATHLLQAALREVLGEHVHQAGSMVDDAVCRFDFTHFSAVTPEQLRKVEDRVNDLIIQGLPVEVSQMTMDEAKKKGAMALFGDKYGDVVRVCDVSGKSVELCGGTHVGNTAQIGLFKILSESSVAAGVRRVEGTTSRGVLAFIGRQEETLLKACEALKVNTPAELVAKAQSVAAQVKELQKEIDALNSKLAGQQLGDLTEDMPQIGPVRLCTALLDGASVDSLKEKADDLKSRYADIVGVFASKGEEKATLLVFAGKDAVSAGIHCGKLVKEIAALAGGSGGGRPDNAMGGIAAQDKLDLALQGAAGLIEAQLGK